MEALARDVLNETNRVRQNPNSYIPYLQDMLSLFKGMVLYKPGEIPLRTNEGPGAVQECINYLKQQSPLRPLSWDDNMTRSAADHANDIGPKGISGHTGSDGSSMSARLSRYGDWMGKIGENIDFGSKTARDIVLSLLVDDGVSNRGHRGNMMSPEYVKTGIACAKHSQWEICTVLDYASEYTTKGGNSGGSQPSSGSYNLSSSPYGFNNVTSTPPPSAASNIPVNYDALARDVFEEQNRVRQRPTSYVPYLEDYLKYFQGMVLKKPGEIPLRTHEGPGAVQDCINFLKLQQALPALMWDDNMAKACRDHAQDIGPKNLSGHTGSDGSSMSGRLERYGDWNGKIGENCDFGNSTGRDVVISLIVDDGVSNRGHRNNLFSSDFQKVGIACAAHQDYKTCTVLDYATQYTLKGANNTQPQQYQQTSYQPSYTQPTSYQPTYTQPTSNYSPSNPTNNYAPGSYTTNSYKTSNPYDNSQVTTTSKTYNSNDINDPYIQEQLKKFNVQGLNNNNSASDPDKPPNTVETLISKNISIVNGKKTITETRTYKLADGSQRITERTYNE